MDSVALLQNDILLNSHPGGRQTYGTPVLVLQKPVILEVVRPTADSTWLVDAFGVRNFGSTMPKCKHFVAVFALYAFVTLVRMVPEWGGSSVA